MSFREQGQRQGRVFYWIVGTLVLILAGLLGYRLWYDSARQDQSDRLVDQLGKAKLVIVKDETPGDPLDWPQWRGIHRDGVAPGEGLPTDWPKGGPKLAWKMAGGGGFSALSIVGKRIVSMVQDGGNEAVVCWEDRGDRAEERWRFARKGRFSQDGEGPRSTPTIAGGFVYVLRPKGELHCLTLEDGKEVWSADMVKDFNATVPKWGFTSSPLIEGDLLLINPGGPDSAVVALERKTGKLVWQALSGHPGYSSPIISTASGIRQVLFFLGEELVSLDPRSGDVYWRFPWKTDYQVNAATPIVVKDRESGDDYVFISSGYGKGCALLRVGKDEDGKPSVEQVYKNNVMLNQFGSSVFYGDHLYGFSEAYLVCMKFRMDKRRSVKPEWKERDFNRGSLMLAGEQFIVLGEKGNVALVDPSPDGFKERARFRIDSDRCWTMPCVAHGRLYIRDEENIYCYDLQAK